MRKIAIAFSIVAAGALAFGCDEAAGPELPVSVGLQIVFPNRPASAPSVSVVVEADPDPGRPRDGGDASPTSPRVPPSGIEAAERAPADAMRIMAAPEIVRVDVIIRSTSGDQTVSLERQADGNTWSKSNVMLQPGVQYTFIVKAFDNLGGIGYYGETSATISSGQTAPVSITVQERFIESTSSLTAIPSGTAITVSWSSVPDATAYELAATQGAIASCGQQQKTTFTAQQTSGAVQVGATGDWFVCLRAALGSEFGSWVTAGPVTIAPIASSMATHAGAVPQTAAVNTAVPIAPAVIVRNQFDQPMAGVQVTFAVTAGDGSVDSPDAVTDAQGIATSVAWTLGTGVGENTLEAVSPPLAPLAFSATAEAGIAQQLQIVTQPGGTARAGLPFTAQPTVQLLDQFGNAKAQSGVPITAAIGSGGGTLLGTATVLTGDDGMAAFPNLAIGGVAGDRTLGFSGPSLATATSEAFALTAGPAAELALSGVPAATTAGTAVDPTVTALDAYGNVATDYVGTVRFLVSDVQGELTDSTYAFLVADAGVHQFAGGITLKTAGDQTVQVEDANDSGITASAASVVAVGPAAPAQVQVEAGDGQTAAVGTVVSPAPAVLVLDAYGNAVPGVEVTFSVTSGSGSMADSVVTSGSDGVATVVDWTLGTVVGANGLSATVTGLAPVAFSATAVAGPAHHLEVTGVTTPVTAGAASDITVTARDQYGNLTPAYTGTVVFSASDGQADLPANRTFAAGDAGQVTLTGGVTLKTAGTQSVTATDNATASITGSQTGIAVDPAATSVLELSGVVTTVTAGDSTDAVVTAKDAYGNTTPAYAGTLDFASSDVQASVPHLIDVTPADGGIVTVADAIVLRTAGTQSLTVFDTTVAAGLADSVIGIQVQPGSVAGFAFRALPNPYEAGVLRSLEITAVDEIGNRVQGYTGTVRLSSSDGGATFNQTLFTFTAGDLGRISDPEVTLVTAGTQSVTAVDTTNTSATGSAQTTVVATDADVLSVAGLPSSTTAGEAQSVTVTALDPYGNVATGYLGTIAFAASGDPLATLPGDYTFVGADAGSHTFTNAVVLATAGTHGVSATDASDASVTGAQTGIVVTPAAADHFTVTPQGFTPGADNVAGTALDVLVTAYDVFDNLVTDYTGTVRVVPSDTSDLTTVPPDYQYVGGDAGAHTFSTTLVSAGTWNVTATDVANSVVSGALSGIRIVHAPVAQLTLAVPDTVAAGVAGDVTVTALDTYGNRVYASDLGLLTFTTDDPSGSAAVPADYTYTAADSGRRVFPGGLTLVTAPLRSVSAALTASGTAAQEQVAVQPGSAASLEFTVEPPAGRPSTVLDPGPQVTARDTYGNVATGFAGAVTLAFTAGTNDEAALLSGNSATAASGIAVFPSVVISKSGLFRLDASAQAGALTATSAEFSIVDPNLRELAFVDEPASGSAGGGLGTIAVQIQDAVGTAVTDLTGDVTLSVVAGTGSGGAVLLGTTTVALSSGVATWSPGDVNIQVAGAGYQLLAQAPNVLDATNNAVSVANATSAAFNVAPASATQLTVSGVISPLAAGTAASVTVTARDPYGNVDTSFAGTVDFTSSDPQAVLPAQYTFVPADGGTHVFTDQVTLGTVGTQAVSATWDTMTGSQSGITVTPGPAASLAFTIQPGEAVAEEVLAPAPRVTAYDAYGNVATGFTDPVTVDLTPATNTEGATLAGGSATAIGGVATFGTVTVSLAGDFTLTATSGALPTAESATFLVTARPASNLVFSLSPSSGAAGTTLSATVELRDDLDQLVTDHTGTIDLAIAEGTGSPGAGLYGTTTVPLVNGVAAFGDLQIELAGAGYRLLAQSNDLLDGGGTSTAVSGALSSTFDVRPAPAAQLVVEDVVSPLTAGTPSPVTVTAVDAYGNVDTAYAGTVGFSSSDATADLPVDYTFQDADDGVHTFAGGVVLYDAGNQTVTATDAANSLSGTQSWIAVQPADASELVVSDVTDPITAGSTADILVVALDPYGNRATGYRGTIHFTSSSAGALPADYVFTESDQGLRAFSGQVQLVTVGEQSVTATDVGTPAITGTQEAITVQPAGAVALVVSGIPDPIVAGVSASVTVEAVDQFGNRATGYGGTVQFSSNDGAAILPSNYQFLLGDQGIHTFVAAVELRTNGERSVTATDVDNSDITGTQAAISVLSAPATELVLTGIADPAPAGTNSTVWVTARDPYGNLAPDYLGTVSFSSNDGQAILPSSYTFTAGDVGAHAFTNGVQMRSAGERSVTVSDGAISGSQTAITVQPAAASLLLVLGVTDPLVANVASNVAVVARDPYGNTATGYRGTVQFTSNDAQAVLPASYTFTAGDAGTHTFPGGVRLRTAGERTVTATDNVTGSITGTQTAITVTPTAPQTVTVTPTVDTALTYNQSMGYSVTAVADTFSNAINPSSATIAWALDNSATASVNDASGPTGSVQSRSPGYTYFRPTVTYQSGNAAGSAGVFVDLWNLETTAGGYEYRDVWSADGTRFWIGGHGQLRRYDNGPGGGYVPFSTAYQINGIWAPNSDTVLVADERGFVVGFPGASTTWYGYFLRCPTAPCAQGVNDVHGAAGYSGSYATVAVGDSGYVVHIDRSTMAMSVQSTPTAADLYGVWVQRGASMVSGQTTAVAVGAGGTILHRRVVLGPFGYFQSWQAQTSPTSCPLYAVWSAGSTNDIWAVGAYNTIIHFDGSTWSLVQGGDCSGGYILLTAATYRGVHGAASNRVFVTGVRNLYNFITRTYECCYVAARQWDGSAWSDVPYATYDAAGLYNVWVGTGDLWAAGGGGIIRARKYWF